MARQEAGAHPEAELLNAFAENALASKERESVLTHLAVCANCREIVGLAVVARPEGAPLVKPARAGFRWATFQWAAVAASVAIVAVAVLVVGPKQSRRTESAPVALHRQSAEPPSAPAASSTSNAVADNRASLPKPEANTTTRLQADKAKAANGVGTGSAAGGAAVGGLVGGMRQSAQEQRNTDLDALAKSPGKKESAAEPAAKSAPSRDFAYTTSASTSDTFVTGRATPSANQPTQGASAGKQIAQAPVAPANAVDGERAKAEEQTKISNDLKKNESSNLSVAANTESVQLSSKARSTTSMYKVNAKSAAIGGIVSTRLDGGVLRLWRVNAGKVQSSDDGGKNWGQKSPADSGPLTKVAAAGQEIFAGGKAGALFLSRDNGQTWTKVSLTGDDVTRLGDVADIRLTSPQMLDVILSTGDDWQSNDAGRSFRLLPRKP